MKTVLPPPNAPAEPFLDRERFARIIKEIAQQSETAPTGVAPAKNTGASRFSKLLDAFYFWTLSR